MTCALLCAIFDISCCSTPPQGGHDEPSLLAALEDTQGQPQLVKERYHLDGFVFVSVTGAVYMIGNATTQPISRITMQIVDETMANVAKDLGVANRATIETRNGNFEMRLPVFVNRSPGDRHILRSYPTTIELGALGCAPEVISIGLDTSAPLRVCFHPSCRPNH